jgi:hypothetical protein
VLTPNLFRATPYTGEIAYPRCFRKLITDQ